MSERSHHEALAPSKLNYRFLASVTRLWAAGSFFCPPTRPGYLHTESPMNSMNSMNSMLRNLRLKLTQPGLVKIFPIDNPLLKAVQSLSLPDVRDILNRLRVSLLVSRVLMVAPGGKRGLEIHCCCPGFPLGVQA